MRNIRYEGSPTPARSIEAGTRGIRVRLLDIETVMPGGGRTESLREQRLGRTEFHRAPTRSSGLNSPKTNNSRNQA